MTIRTNPLPDMMAEGIRRRACIELQHPSELAIRVALSAVEGLGSDPLLFDAAVLLRRAHGLVADWLEGGQKPAQTS